MRFCATLQMDAWSVGVMLMFDMALLTNWVNVVAEMSEMAVIGMESLENAAIGIWPPIEEYWMLLRIFDVEAPDAASWTIELDRVATTLDSPLKFVRVAYVAAAVAAGRYVAVTVARELDRVETTFDSPLKLVRVV